MTFIVIGGLLGLILGGVQGALIGVALGYAAGWYIRSKIIGSLKIAQTQLVDTTFAVMGALSKADGVVTRDEINMAEQVFDMLHLNDPQRKEAKAAFSRGKQPDFDLDATVDAFAAVTRGRGPLLQLFMQLQCMAVAADGRVDPAEHTMLVRIARRLGLGERDVAQLEALLRAATAGPAGSAGGDPQQRLSSAYEALGVSADATDAEVKRAYRKLISENHPDKLASRGLPESMRAVAEERSREINKAYDLIKEARGIV
ncbi:MAG: co-chaperone DjlA [Pseudomonadota bacterium]